MKRITKVLLASLIFLMVPISIFADNTNNGIKLSGSEGVDWEFYGDNDFGTVVIKNSGVAISGNALSDIDILISEGVTQVELKNLDRGDNTIFINSDEEYVSNDITINISGVNDVNSIDIYDGYDQVNTLSLIGSDKENDLLSVEGDLIGGEGGLSICDVGVTLKNVSDDFGDSLGSGLISQGTLSIQNSSVDATWGIFSEGKINIAGSDIHSAQGVHADGDIIITDSNIVSDNSLTGNDIQFDGSSKVDIRLLSSEEEDIFSENCIHARGAVVLSLDSADAYVSASSIVQGNWAISSSEGILFHENNGIQNGGNIICVKESAYGENIFTLEDEELSIYSEIKIICSEDVASPVDKSGVVKPPKKIKNLTIESVEGENKVILSWENNVRQSGCQISKSGNSTSTGDLYDSSSPKEASRIITANKGRIYYYKIRAYILVDGKAIYGPWSDTVKHINHLEAPENMNAELYDKYNSVKIKWDKVDEATGYYVYGKKETSSTYSKLTRTTKLSYTKTGLSAGTVYDFKIIPYYKTKSGKYVKSENFSATKEETLKKLTPPTLEINEADDSKVIVKWVKDERLAGYEVSKSTSSSKTEKVYRSLTPTEESAAIEATKGRPYYYKVRGYIEINGSKIYTPWSKTTKYINPLDAPEDVKAELYGYNDVKVSWSKSPKATGYYVYYKKASGTKWKQGARTTKLYAKIKNLDSGIEYEFKVIPYYKKSSSSTYHKSEKFALTTAVTMKKLATPVVGKDIEIEGNVLVSWAITGPADAYEISRSTSSSKTSVVETLEGGDLTSASIEGAKKGKKYYYKVRAIKYVDGTAIKVPWSTTKAYTYK